MLLFGFFHFQGNRTLTQVLDEPAHVAFPCFALFAGLFSQPPSVQHFYAIPDEPVRDKALVRQVGEEFHDFPLFGNQGMKALVLC